MYLGRLYSLHITYFGELYVKLNKAHIRQRKTHAIGKYAAYKVLTIYKYKVIMNEGYFNYKINFLLNL